jgi:hypothetical protein
MFADLIPSASGESEVSKHSSPTNHQPKNKIKTKSQSQDQSQKLRKSKPYQGARAAKGAG